MTHYSEEFRASVAARLLHPNNARIADIVKETGVPKDTLYDWRARYRNKQGVSRFFASHQTNTVLMTSWP